MSFELITPATAGDSQIVNIYDDAIPSTLIGSGLGAAEGITIEVETNSGTFVAWKISGAQVQIDGDDNILLIESPGTYKFTKGTTVGDAGLYISNNTNN